MEPPTSADHLSSRLGVLSTTSKAPIRKVLESSHQADEAVSDGDRFFPTHLSLISRISHHPHLETQDSEEVDNYAINPNSLLDSSTSKPFISYHVACVEKDLYSGYTGRPKCRHIDLTNKVHRANFLVLNQESVNQPIISQIYPSVFTYDFWDADDDTENNVTRSSAVHEPYLGLRKPIGVSSEVTNRFDNVKHVNNFFMADETRLPIYIAAFGSGFFSVIMGLCAVLYIKYIFTNMRNMKADAKKRRRVSQLSLFDNHTNLHSQNHESLAQVKALNPALARIEDYTSGDVKKWDNRVKLAEGNNDAWFEDIVNEMGSEDESDDDDALKSIVASADNSKNKKERAPLLGNKDVLLRKHIGENTTKESESDYDSSEEEDSDEDDTGDEVSDDEEDSSSKEPPTDKHKR